ncbi:MAG: hypothetical protein AB1656_11955 [Candidatus Omnitrophota bacterium]
MASLTNMQDLRTILGHLNAEKPAGLGLKDGETARQERGGDFLRRLNLELESRQGKARVLVTGQIGVGKSTELLHFFHNHGGIKKTGYWIFCNLEKDEHPERCGATGVFLTILRDCWGATRNLRNKADLPQRDKKEYLQLRDEILKRLIDWLKGEIIEDDATAIFRFGNMDFPVFLEEKGQALALILGKASQHEAVSQRSEQFGLVPDSLVNLLNKLLIWIKNAWYERPPVLIVDHVDKIRDSTAASEVLKESIPHWQRIEASIIMTAPYEYTLGEMRHSVESYWGRPLMIYPLEIPELDESDIPSIYHDILKSCGLYTLITTDSLRLLAHYSGGIPRSFVQFLIEASKEAHLSGHKRIETSDAQAIIYNAERAYQDYGPTQMDLLDQITQNKIGLNQSAYLLRSPIGLLVLEAKEGVQPLRVHPLAQKMLERYRMNPMKSAI